MYTIDFYEKNGKSQILEFLEDLRKRINSSKDARIQYSQVSTYIQLLSDNGTVNLPKTVAKHLDGEIWELRPGNNRVFFFFYSGENTYVLLHQFRKKSQKTPAKEHRKAKAEKEDYVLQKTNRGKGE